MAKGTIEEIDSDAVQIDGILYRLASTVKAEYIRKGKCEYSIDADGETATFVKMEKSEKTRTFGKNKPSSIKTDSQFREPTEIIRQECLTTAKDIAIANKDKDIVKSENVIALAKKFEDYVTGKTKPNSDSE